MIRSTFCLNDKVFINLFLQMRFSLVRRFASSSVSREQRIRSALLEQLQAEPSSLSVEDLSGGCDGGTVRLFVVSPLFAGKSVVAQHRMVNEVLKEEMKSLHAAVIKTAAKQT
jgi:stress-induced morphogen